MNITFKASTFSRPARLAALQRIGHHVKKATFCFPRNLDTMLAPLINPWTGEEKEWTWRPQIKPEAQQSRYGDKEVTELLVKQYPPLFHASTNVSVFVKAVAALTGLQHLCISCPETVSGVGHQGRDIVTYALTSLRLAISAAELPHLDRLTLASIRQTDIFYLSPLANLGANPSSTKRWSQIRHLEISMSGCSSCPDANKLLQAYLLSFRNLATLSFVWLNTRGPSPLPFPRSSSLNASQRKQHPALRSDVHAPLFPHLTYLAIENALLPAPLVASLIKAHKRDLKELELENVKLRDGTWDDALGVLEGIDVRSKSVVEVEEGDVPIMLGSAVAMSHGHKGSKSKKGIQVAGESGTEAEVRRMLMAEEVGTTETAAEVETRVQMKEKQTKERKKKLRDKGWSPGERFRKTCGGILGWRVRS